MKSQTGRTLIEVLSVLAIIGVLSTGGLFGYTYVMRQKAVDNIADTLQKKMVEIDLAQPKRKITDPVRLNAFLKRFETTVGSYKISFYASEDRDGSFFSDITHKNGQRISGSFCRKLMSKMAEQKFASDVSFSLKDELQEDGSRQDINISLNGKTVNWDDICGG